MLTEAEKDRAREEEIVRSEVRRELGRKQSTDSLRHRVWALLNSSFVLWLLSSVVLTLLTSAITRYQAKRTEEAHRAIVTQRLDTEIGNRISQAMAGLRVTEHNIQQGARWPPAAMYTLAVQYVNNSFIHDTANPQDFSVYTDFRERNFRSLLVELSSVVPEDEQSMLSRSLDAYERLADLGSRRARYGPSQHPDSVAAPTHGEAEALAALANTREILAGELRIPRWRAPLFDRPPGGQTEP